MVVIIYILIAFLAGIIFMNELYPLFDQLISTISMRLDVSKAKMALKVAELNSEAQKLQDEKKEKSSIRAIGFTIPTEDEDDDYEEEDE